MDAFEGYLTVKKNMARDTVDVKGRRLRFATRDFGLRPERFKTSEAGEAEAHRYLTARTRAGVGPEAYNQDLFLLKNLASFYGWTLDIEHKPKAPPDPNPLAVPQVVKLLKFRPKGKPETVLLKRALVAFHTYMGFRPTECNGIDLAHLDLTDPKKPTVRIEHPGKDGEKRTLPLPLHLISPHRPFGAYLAWRRSLTTREPALWVVRRKVPGGDGIARLSRWRHGQHVSNVSKAAGVKAHATRLRHTVGTRLTMGKDSNIIDAARQLGHRNLETTRKNYVRFTTEDHRRRTRSAQPDFLATEAAEQEAT